MKKRGLLLVSALLALMVFSTTQYGQDNYKPYVVALGSLIAESVKDSVISRKELGKIKEKFEALSVVCKNANASIRDLDENMIEIFSKNPKACFLLKNLLVDLYPSERLASELSSLFGHKIVIEDRLDIIKIIFFAPFFIYSLVMFIAAIVAIKTDPKDSLCMFIFSLALAVLSFLYF